LYLADKARQFSNSQTERVVTVHVHTTSSDHYIDFKLARGIFAVRDYNPNNRHLIIILSGENKVLFDSGFHSCCNILSEKEVEETVQSTVFLEKFYSELNISSKRATKNFKLDRFDLRYLLGQNEG
jgi:hypothetical protein